MLEPAALLGDEFADRAEVDTEAVVLARDLHRPVEQVLHGLVAAAMTVLELVRRGAYRKREHLMSQAYAEDRLLAEKRAQRPVEVVHGRRVAGAVRQEHSVWVARENVIGRRRGGDDGHVATGLGEAPQDVVLDAGIERDDAVARLHRQDSGVDGRLDAAGHVESPSIGFDRR